MFTSSEYGAGERPLLVFQKKASFQLSLSKKEVIKTKKEASCWLAGKTCPVPREGKGLGCLAGPALCLKCI